MLWFLFVAIEVSEWLNHACQAYVDNNSSLSSSDSLLRRPGRSLGNTRITHGGKSPSKSILNKWPHNTCLKVHVKSSNSLRHSKRVNVAEVLPSSEKTMLVSACVCMSMARYFDGLSDALDVTWNFDRYCEWRLCRLCHLRMVHLPSLVRCLGHEAPKELRRTARNGRALNSLPLRKLCLRREETSRRTTDEFQRLNIFKMFKAQKKRLDPSWSVHLTGGLHANMQLR